MPTEDEQRSPRVGRALGPRWLLVAVLVFLGADRGAGADECADRLADAQARLHHEAHRLRSWRWGWGLAVGVATVAQAAIVPVLDDPGTRIDMAVSAGSTLVGLVPIIWAPTVDDREPVGDTSCARLADAERRLSAAAAEERSARGPWIHITNLALNTALGLLLGLAWGHWTSGVLSAVSGAALGEAELLTLPVAVAPMPHAIGLALSWSF